MSIVEKQNHSLESYQRRIVSAQVEAARLEGELEMKRKEINRLDAIRAAIEKNIIIGEKKLSIINAQVEFKSN